MKQYKLSEKLYKLTILIFLFYVMFFFIVFSYLFNKKVLNELNYTSPDNSVFILNNDRNLINISIKRKKEILTNLLNLSNNKTVYDYLNTFADKRYISSIIKELKTNFFHSKKNIDIYLNESKFLTFEKIQGNIIKNGILKNLTTSSFSGIVETNTILQFTTKYSTLKRSKFYNIYSKFNEDGKLQQLTITKNKNMENIVDNKITLEIIESKPEYFYNYVSNDMLNTAYISEIRNSKINSIKIIGSKFKGDDLISFIFINNIKYKILIHNKKITKIQKIIHNKINKY